MAKGIKARKGSKVASKKSVVKPKVPLTVVPDYPASFPSFYSNYATVSHTASEIFVDCCLMALPYKVNLEDGQINVPVIARIIFPPDVSSGLIKALEAQLEKQKKTKDSGAFLVPIQDEKT